MSIPNPAQPITIPHTGTLSPPAPVAIDHDQELRGGPWATTTHLAVLTDADDLGPIIHKLSTLGQIDNLMAWAFDALPYQVYCLVTFRYASDMHRALRPLRNATSKAYLIKQADAPIPGYTLNTYRHDPFYNNPLASSFMTTSVITHPQEIGIIQHHPYPDPAVGPEPEGTTRSVVFFDSRGNMIRMTPKFSDRLEKAWERVRETLLAEMQPHHDGESSIARVVPEPWRGKWWILWPTWDLKRNRATFESVDIAARVIKKMKREKWGGAWDVKEGRYVSDPISMEDLADGEPNEDTIRVDNEVFIRHC